MTLRSRQNRQREALDCGRVSFIPRGGKGSQGSQHEGDEGSRRHYILDYVGYNYKSREHQ